MSLSGRNPDSFSLQLPSRIMPSTGCDNPMQQPYSSSSMSFNLPQINIIDHKWQSNKSPEDLKLPSLLALPIPPSLPKEETQSNTPLRSDRSLMKAPSKGSPGSRKSKTPFERKAPNFGKSLIPVCSPPIQHNRSPEQCQYLPIQIGKSPNNQSMSPECSNVFYQKGNGIESQGEASFVITTSSYETGK